MTLPDLPLVRPQTALLIFFGDFVADAGVLVAGGSVIELLDRLGVGEHAARATLSRMVRRGLLHREVRGRRAYYGLTGHGRRTMVAGRTRVQEGEIVTRDWDGRWTLVAFSMPESWQRQRHDLRSRLVWHGFGPAQAGLWVAPRRVDVQALLEGLALDGYVRAFEAEPLPPTDAGRLVADAFDLTDLSVGYQEFDRRWRPYLPAAERMPDPLGCLLLLTGDWLQLVRDDPRLPVQFLPGDWPAPGAEAVFRGLGGRLRDRAGAQLRDQVDVIEAVEGIG